MNIPSELTINNNPTIADLQAHMLRTCKHHKWDTLSSLETFLLFSEEVGELAKAIRKTLQIQVESAKSSQAQLIRDNLEEELADCFSYLVDLANRFDVNLGEAYQKKTNENLSRSWK